MTQSIGFFVNWVGDQNGEGFEYNLIAIALAFLIMVRGAGALFIDYMMSSRNFRTNRERSRGYADLAKAS